MRKRITIDVDIIESDYIDVVTDEAIKTNIGTAVKDALVSSYITSYNKVDILDVSVQ